MAGGSDLWGPNAQHVLGPQRSPPPAILRRAKTQTYFIITGEQKNLNRLQIP